MTILKRQRALAGPVARVRVSIVFVSLYCWLANSAGFAEVVDVAGERPILGRSVEVDGKYLLPYQVTIPGSQVSFAMEPVPGGAVSVRTAEGKQQEFVLTPFWMGRCEVTWGEYRQYMRLCSLFERFNDAGIRPVTEANVVDAVTAPSKLYDPSFTYAAGEGDRLPAVSMSQYAAKQYTKWLSLLTEQFYRLPSDAEWEHACRAGTTTAYSFGDDPDQIDAYAWHEENSDWETQPIASKRPNAWGLYDMHGNACEWVLDAYRGTVFDADGAGGEPPWARATRLYPRTLRGGSVLFAAAELTSDARRASDDEALRSYDPNTPKSPWWFANDDALDIGFRILRPYVVPQREVQETYWQADVARIQEVADLRIDQEGRGERGVVDPALVEAAERLRAVGE